MTGLQKGDLLVGINGQPFSGEYEDLVARMRLPGPQALTFLRGGLAFTILTTTADLGVWEVVARPSALPALPSPADLRGWIILRRADGAHEALPDGPSLLALAAPALWLAQMRLWTWLGLLVASLALALPGGIAALVAVWLAFGVHLWRRGALRVLSDRLAAGGAMLGQIAAPDESAAQSAWSALDPAARFFFPADAGPPISAEGAA